MDRRLELQALLETILGSRNVYFQPPANIIMQYPAIVYHRDQEHTVFADDFPYKGVKRYQITYIDRNPDSPIPDQIGALQMSTFSNHFVADNLNHDVYSVYF